MWVDSAVHMLLQITHLTPIPRHPDHLGEPLDLLVSGPSFSGVRLTDLASAQEHHTGFGNRF